ncbi:MAG: hypothetical protein ACM3N1_00195, partial [Accumulibacter sp.]
HLRTASEKSHGFVHLYIIMLTWHEDNKFWLPQKGRGRWGEERRRGGRDESGGRRALSYMLKSLSTN